MALLILGIITASIHSECSYSSRLLQFIRKVVNFVWKSKGTAVPFPGSHLEWTYLVVVLKNAVESILVLSCLCIDHCTFIKSSTVLIYLFCCFSFIFLVLFFNFHYYYCLFHIPGKWWVETSIEHNRLICTFIEKSKLQNHCVWIWTKSHFHIFI